VETGNNFSNGSMSHVKWVLCHHGIICIMNPQVAVGGCGRQIWRVVMNMSFKQSRIFNKGWSSGIGDGWGSYDPSIKKLHVTKRCTGFWRWTDSLKRPS
jgi:hypothetical protein